MRRGQRRLSSGAPAAVRWIAANARDVTRVERGQTHLAESVQTVAGGLGRWQRRLERRRRLAFLRRTLLVTVAAAGALQIGALISGHSGTGPWLVPAALAAAAALAFGVAHRTNAQTAARLIDRDLGLGARVTTALELESSPVQPHGLGVLALADGRAALAASLAFARARLQPQRGELALLGALVVGLAALLIVPSPRGGATPAALARVKAAGPPPGSRALRADNGLPTSPGAGPSLQGFKQTPLDSPPLAAVQAGSTHAGGAASGHSPYGGGVPNNATSSAPRPSSKTVGQSGSVKGTQDDGGTGTGASQGKGSLPNGPGGAGKNNIAGGSSVSKGGPGAEHVAPAADSKPTGTAPGKASPGQASSPGNGQSKGGIGSSAPGSGTSRKSGGKVAPGGATAGTQVGGKNRGSGVVPQLGGKSALPIAPGYEAVPGASPTTHENSSSAVGRGGGAARSGQAVGGAAGSGGGTGVPYVPPAGSNVASIDRGVVLGYFASFARVNSSGW